MRIIRPIRFIIPLLSGRGRGRRGGGRAVNAGKRIVRARTGLPQKPECPAGRVGGYDGGITSPGANAACRNLGTASVGQRILFRPRSDGNDHRGVNITPELEHRKSGYVERKRRPYQGNVVRIA